MPRTLRSILNEKTTVVAPGAYDAISARLIEQSGFPAVFVGGFATSAVIMGAPDYGLLTMSEMLAHAKSITNATHIPVIADIDDGYGNAINVLRTVREYARAGVAAVVLEDQESPKRSALYSGKRRIISTHEMVGKIRAACKAKNNNNELMLIVRTDAFSAGLDINEAVQRGKAYLDAGADIVGAIPPSVRELGQWAKAFDGRKYIYANSPYPFAKLNFKQITDMGFNLIIINSMIFVSLQAIKKALRKLREGKSELAIKGMMMPLKQYNEIVDLERFQRYDKEFLPR